MSFKDFALMAGVCLIWALNNIVSKLIISEHMVPPMFYAGARFAVVALATLPWLLPAPRPLWRTILVALLMGGGTFSLFFMGLKTASPSAATIVGQLGLPVTTLLSVLMLGETIKWPRRIGIALTFVGVLIVMWDPAGFAASKGLLYIAAGAVAGSFGAVLLKKMEGVRPMQLQAWVGVTSVVPMVVFSAAFEPGGFEAARATGWLFPAAVLFSGLLVSVLAHTVYFGLIQRYEANLIAPLTLMVPLATIALGVAFTHDAFGLRMAAGTSVALAGVLVIALRKSHVGAVRMWLKERV
jgi:drug/metabolite transporter (DMT)-like permease